MHPPTHTFSHTHPKPSPHHPPPRLLPSCWQRRRRRNARRQKRQQKQKQRRKRRKGRKPRSKQRLLPLHPNQSLSQRWPLLLLLLLLGPAAAGGHRQQQQQQQQQRRAAVLGMKTRLLRCVCISILQSYCLVFFVCSGVFTRALLCVLGEGVQLGYSVDFTRIVGQWGTSGRGGGSSSGSSSSGVG